MVHFILNNINNEFLVFISDNLKTFLCSFAGGSASYLQPRPSLREVVGVGPTFLVYDTNFFTQKIFILNNSYSILSEIFFYIF